MSSIEYNTETLIMHCYHNCNCNYLSFEVFGVCPQTIHLSCFQIVYWKLWWSTVAGLLREYMFPCEDQSVIFLYLKGLHDRPFWATHLTGLV